MKPVKFTILKMNIVTKLLTYQNQVKILHWQTTSFSAHEALGELYGSFNDKVDSFIEVFMGKYGRIMSQNSFNLSLENYNNMPPLSLILQIEQYLIGELPDMLDSQKDTDLLNIKDELLASVNKTKYLLSLK